MCNFLLLLTIELKFIKALSCLASQLGRMSSIVALVQDLLLLIYSNLEKAKKKVDRLKEQLHKLEVQATDKVIISAHFSQHFSTW